MENPAAGTTAAGRITRGIWFDKVLYLHSCYCMHHVTDF